jgi:hypothetical protein
MRKRPVWEGTPIPPCAKYVEFLGDGGFSQIVNPPPLITDLVFGSHFNRSVDHLPSTLTHIWFGSLFNHPADRLPDSIIQLSFGVFQSSSRLLTWVYNLSLFWN